MKKLFLFTCIVILSYPVLSQKQTDKWFFGNSASLDFTSGSPVVVNSGSFSIVEGSSSVSTATGTLLFYTDGVSVWDTTHATMPNGTGLMGDISTTQSALIVPSPSNASQYYIFTLAADGGPNGFRYSLVDMTLNGSLGDVTTKNTFIQDSVTEKLAAVKDAAGTGYWVVIHKWGTNAFESYHLTAAGLQPPVVSSTGIVYSTSQIQNTYGQMKFSACGSRLAVAAGYLDTAEVFDFDINTGIVSNPITIPMFSHVYGIEFSASSDFLYVSRYTPNTTLLQFDLTQSSSSAIVLSELPLSSTSDIYALQRATDGKIYVVKSFSQFLGVINSPDIAGPSCNYVDNGFDLDPNFMGNSAAIGLPDFMQSYLDFGVSCSTVGIKDVSDVLNNPTVFPNPSSSEFTFEFTPSIHSNQLAIFDCTGRLMEKYNSLTSRISFGKLYTAGVYFIKVINGDSMKVIKVVKM